MTPQVRFEIEVFADDPRVEITVIEVVGSVDKLVGMHRFETQHDIICIQGYQIDAIKPLRRERRQQIELPRSERGCCHNGDVQIAFRPRPPSCR
ncbi:MAG: hypothetical protein A3E57_07640 [Candidatus Muproteobacteria bacterium RIFCSPHIGHO2_12_FULL_60_33]|uniref:Uncharacterized protein n=1 Tax=Candidatus Muproteobacteria bacterium RIFCSPLOWO2_01_FULL_60_18 TaxID=1817768 RepID=A0A1F6TYX0_9PROT|nr:MAG: hypothetical protein A2W42_06320 [Candidatus Muproteobacteria bacterium RIFCSPHIGHO2_01_60_12]OGI50297.1 MAG: hypothetical protein A3A87_09310 [Candidatus Muproteobacteria bacterium RIFCSPLOWO2_01_FULL_60_18]OGI54455.1 MAG: hypothetical protein A3E57_07640 [Candidatus Muproteobacteria bacterium RIFCSPHIGHO2_12_FULL_60_33]